jgi:hypothetical protein
LDDKQRFPDSLFTALASSESRSSSDARISSGSSWCAPVSDGKHYLQVDLGRLYVIYNFATFGDSTSPKWVTTYNLNYTVDLINWKSVWNQSVVAIYYFIGASVAKWLAHLPSTSKAAGSSPSENPPPPNATRTQSSCGSSKSQRSAESRGLPPGTPVSYHRESQHGGLGKKGPTVIGI